MADWNGFKKNGTTYIPNDATARAGVIANTKLIKDTVGWSGKNKNGSKYTGLTTQGVTFTVNPDNSVKGNGTNSSSSNEARPIYTNFNLKAGSYKFSCKNATANFYAFVWDATNSRRLVTVTDSADHEFSVDSDIEAGVLLSVPTAVTINNQTLYPMIRDADIIDDTYEPYFGSTAFPRSEQAVLGAVNQWPTLASGYTHTEGGVTFTWLEDGSVDINGSSTSDFTYVYEQSNQGLAKLRGDWVARSLGSDSISGLNINLYKSTSSSWNLSAINTEIPLTFTDAEHASGKLGIYVAPNRTFDHVIVKPVLYPASVPSDTPFIPYAMTNREMTEKQIITEYIEGSTTASSNLVTTFDVAEREILCAYGASLLAMPYFYFDSGQGKNFWCFHVTDNALQNVASTNVKIYYSYIKK